MLKFEWNALRIGDGVLVHDPRDAELGLIRGAVLMVDSNKGKRPANDVGIRVGAGDEQHVLWPSYLAVHRDPNDPLEDCWRCDTVAAEPVPLR